MLQIKFSHNWNNKLGCNIFTTIRKHEEAKEEYYKANIGKTFSIVMSNNQIKGEITAWGEAELKSVYVEKISDISVLLLMLDTGMTSEANILELFKRLGVKDKAIILLFEKLQPKTDLKRGLW
jgi:hypothetical protein